MNVKPVSSVNTLSRMSSPEQTSYDSAKQGIKGQEEQKEEKQVKITREDAENLVEVMNQFAELFNRSLHFKVYDKTDQLYVQIVDKYTQEVIKQIPPQEMLELSAKIREMVGILFDECV